MNNSTRWPPYLPENKTYLSLDVNQITVGNELKETECVFWNEYIPRLINIIGKFYLQIVLI